MARAKATVRITTQATVQRIGIKDILNSRVRNSPYKIKKLLPQTKMVVEVKKNGQVLRQMNGRGKCDYLFGSVLTLMKTFLTLTCDNIIIKKNPL